MTFKFSLLDEESKLVVGYCQNVVGLSGSEHFMKNDEVHHKLILTDFYFNEDYKKYSRETKMYINNLYISVINKDKQPIGSYYFYLSKPIYFNKIGVDENITNIKLIGTLMQVVSNEAIKLWDLWREQPPLNKNQWANLSEEERRGWLEIVRLYDNPVRHKYKDKINETVYLDGTYITDYSSFFCALGEAINGPGGYYGCDFPSLRDCFCGGFGAVPPFTIIWSKSHVAMENLTKQAWLRQILYKEQKVSENSDEDILVESGDKALFQAIIELFAEKNIEIIFN